MYIRILYKFYRRIIITIYYTTQYLQKYTTQQENKYEFNYEATHNVEKIMKYKLIKSVFLFSSYLYI